MGAPAMRIMQVPFNLREDELPDEWSCQDNVWDPERRSCAVEQVQRGSSMANYSPSPSTPTLAVE